ncbi:MAG: MBL fold metallo-hydrolase [Candidatus Eremiobacteraeota bacterium]|nr:MBL fold metallo-hydrolase [Candidatus Eremiobacteraeota bacterium]
MKLDSLIAPLEATLHTRKVNNSVLDKLDFSDKEDFEDATRGFIGKIEDGVIRNDKGQPVWDLNQYKFLEEEKCPDTVNPSLWRQGKLNMFNGLFKVTDRIYQVRGHDLSVISFIKSDNGYIVIDPLISAECAKASLDLLYKHIGEKPVVAVIYTHSHTDHYGGVKGVVSEEDVNSGKVKIIAPEGFLEAAISENVMAGTAMSRRAIYMYGPLLPKGPKGQVDAGLGKTISQGTVTLFEPTHYITRTGQEMMIDGVKVVFQLTPNTEAPAEMNFYFPQFRALCIAENCNHNLHNLYTLRGAKVRDAKAWAHYINEAIVLFGDKSDVIFAGHHWPHWGKTRIIDFMKKQRDMYKYLHDQTLRLANLGYTMIEIAEMVKLPEDLAGEWYNRGYYGTVSHDVKAIYQRYLGWFDGNPANLHPLPPVEASKKYVEFMGGAEAVLTKAREAFEKGEYRWVAQVVNHVVFADPNNKDACNLQADALEQLGYQAESGPWRCFYLTGATELRNGVPVIAAFSTASPDTVKAMSLEMIFDYMGVKLNGPKADGKKIKLNMNFTDIKQKFLLELENSVLNNTIDKQAKDADATITLTRAALDEVILGRTTVKEKVESGEIKVEGDREKIKELFSLLDKFDEWFNIVTP